MGLIVTSITSDSGFYTCSGEATFLRGPNTFDVTRRDYVDFLKTVNRGFNKFYKKDEKIFYPVGRMFLSPLIPRTSAIFGSKEIFG